MQHEEPTLALLQLKVDRFRLGSEDAAMFLRARFLNLAKRCAYKHLACPDDVEDAVEEAFAKLWARRSSVPENFEALRVYLLRMVENCAIDVLRRSEDVRAARVGVKRATDAEEQICQMASNEDEQDPILSDFARTFLAGLSCDDLDLLNRVGANLAEPTPPQMRVVYARIGAELGQNPLYIRNRWSRVQKGLKRHLGRALSPTETRTVLCLLNDESHKYC